MKHILIFATLLILSATAAIAQPKLQIVGGDTYDWGNTPPKVLFTKIYIKNVGNETLYISEVKPSCGCTSAPLDRNSVPPGEQAEMKVNLSLDISLSGQVKKYVKILSNDPKNPEKTLTLRCNVVSPILVTPKNYLTFKDVTVGMVATCELNVENKTSETVTFSNFEMSDGLSINWTKNVTVKPGKSVKLKVTFMPNQTGYNSLHVKFKTSCKDMQYITISGGAKVSGADYFNY